MLVDLGNGRARTLLGHPTSSFLVFTSREDTGSQHDNKGAFEQLTSGKPLRIDYQGGLMSTVSCVYLKSIGFENLNNIKGGFGKMTEVGVETTDFDLESRFLSKM